MRYTKGQMIYDINGYYEWKSLENNSESKVNEEKANRTLNRTMGEEVLDFINEFCNRRKAFKEARLPDFRRIEKMIRFSVPKKIQSYPEISEWIVENWNQQV
jgi:hypothetical protein